MTIYPILFDWRMLGFTFLWIIGFAISLLTISFAYYGSHLRRESVRSFFDQPGFQTGLNGGLSLFCLGFAGSSNHWLVIVVFSGIAAWFLVRIIFAIRSLRSERPN